MMKKLIVLILLALIIGACSDEFLAHDTLYKPMIICFSAGGDTKM
jgi:hypothetical protein